jgi:hypothetical protein
MSPDTIWAAGYAVFVGLLALITWIVKGGR